MCVALTFFSFLPEGRGRKGHKRRLHEKREETAMVVMVILGLLDSPESTSCSLTLPAPSSQSLLLHRRLLLFSSFPVFSSGSLLRVRKTLKTLQSSFSHLSFPPLEKREKEKRANGNKLLCHPILKVPSIGLPFWYERKEQLYIWKWRERKE